MEMKSNFPYFLGGIISIFLCWFVVLKDFDDNVCNLISSINSEFSCGMMFIFVLDFVSLLPLAFLVYLIFKEDT